MFTGIVEETGTVKEVKRSRNSMQLSIYCNTVLTDTAKGDSIAVNGVCLTVAYFTDSYFVADVMPETYFATTLSELTLGNEVNLERAIAANGRFGGHFVTGHVDGTGKITAKRQSANALYMDIQIEQNLLRFVMNKGSITVDGTSLTVFDVKDDRFTISLIPVTQKDSVIARKQMGSKVNVECDILVKYMEQLLFKKNQYHSGDGLTIDKLASSGFLI